MGCRLGPMGQDPFSLFGAPRTPGPLGCNDAADPNVLTLRGQTPGSLGVNDDAGLDVSRIIDPVDFDYLMRHKESKAHLVESTRLASLHLKDKRNLWRTASVWKIAEAVVFRVGNLSEDLDGNPRAYHPPTDASWNGFGPGLGKDSLLDAVSTPSGVPYSKSKPKDESLWTLTAGCQTFRDLHAATGLEAKAGPPAAAGAGSGSAAPANKAAQDARTAADAIYKKYGVTKLSELETKSKSAVCVLYVDGRSKADSRKDWDKVTAWAGIQTDSTGKPLLRASGANKGFYIPRITPGWADPDKHAWVVLNKPEDEFGVTHTNKAVVIKNGETPVVAYGMVADSGPEGHLGEVSTKMMADLAVTAAHTEGDFIMVLFPEPVSAADQAKEIDVATMQGNAKAAFEAWTWEGRSGLDLIQELFPSPEKLHQVQKDFADSKQYLSAHVDQMILKLK